MNQPSADIGEQPVRVENQNGSASVVLACEHASQFIPAQFNGLGLDAEAKVSHAAWDPGAGGVARHMADALDAVLVAGGVSRLIYDCNRPPNAPDAMPEQSEVFAIPGNRHLTDAQRAERIHSYYRPFQAALAKALKARSDPILVTIHSFTPVYHGRQRDVEIGVLHDKDTRLADALLVKAADHTDINVQRNQPYGPQDGVMHTLREHGIAHGHQNVMLEIRNDLIATKEQQIDIANMLCSWLGDALAKTGRGVA